MYFDFVNERSREMGEVVRFQQPQVERNGGQATGRRGLCMLGCRVWKTNVRALEGTVQDLFFFLLSSDTVCR